MISKYLSLVSAVAASAAAGWTAQVNVYEYGCGNGCVGSISLYVPSGHGLGTCQYWNPPKAWYGNIVWASQDECTCWDYFSTSNCEGGLGVIQTLADNYVYTNGVDCHMCSAKHDQSAYRLDV
jgi:hypothetical protein